MGLSKHGKKKCVVYKDGRIPAVWIDVKFVNKELRYYCEACGERLLKVGTGFTRLTGTAP